MALPFDALTAALDAWLSQHIANTTRRARVRRSVDCLDDLRTAPYAHIEFATDVSSWPAIPGVCPGSGSVGVAMMCKTSSYMRVRRVNLEYLRALGLRRLAY